MKLAQRNGQHQVKQPGCDNEIPDHAPATEDRPDNDDRRK